MVVNPPWIEFPEYERHCMGWRMGPGDGYIPDFCIWLSELDGRQGYISKHPEPKGWEGFYEPIPRVK